MTLFLLQMIVVLATALCCGRLARALGQARVIGEIFGGILLGPSVLGRVAPHASATLFPAGSLAPFELLSTVGLILFLFMVGCDLDYEHLRRHGKTATLASITSLLLPFAMALAVAAPLQDAFVSAPVDLLPFALFLGISMSITAFPVLARILEERGIQNSPIGVIALMCAAAEDVCAWALLAVALALLPSSTGSSSLPLRFAALAAYVAVMLFLVRPVAKRMAARRGAATPKYEFFAIAIVLAFASAAVTNAIGVHPLFGAFLAGLCFPRVPLWQESIRLRFDTVVSALLLPLFFTLTGLRTRLDLLASPQAWFWTAVILGLAIAGKIGGAALAARWTGHSWRDALTLGVLLDTRGLVELVVLNIAYDARVFSPTLFTLLVVMALITTASTVPLLNILQRAETREGTRV